MLHLLKTIVLVKRAERLDAGQVGALQEVRFRKLLRHAFENSNFYRNLYEQNGITADNIDTFALKDLPAIDKEIVMENYDELVCDPALKRENLEKFIHDPENLNKKYKDFYQVLHTSGTTGTTGIFVYAPHEWNVVKALSISRVSKAKINPFRKTNLAFLGAINGHYAGVCLIQDAPRILFNILPLSINRPISEIDRELQEYQPDIISGYASGIAIIAEEQIKERINIKPKRIICSGDVMTLGMRETIKKAFNIEPINFYAASEALAMAAECELHRGLHLFTDWNYFEVVDKNLNPVAAGKPGELLITNLYNYTQPLIRYRIHDKLVLDDKNCSCGSPFPLIKHIAGRKDDVLWFEKPGGDREYLHWSYIDELLPGLHKYQIIQTGKNTLLMKVIIHDDVEQVLSKIRAQMDGILAEKHLGNTVSYKLEVVSGIPNDPKTGKFRFIIPYR